MSIAKDTIGVGFIGAGDISILHAAAVKKCPGAKLVGLWNRNQDRAKRAGRASSAARTTRRPRSWSTTRPSTRCSCSPTSNRTSNTPSSPSSAGKHVLVEKPVGVSVAEIEQMRDLADAKKLVCMPGHNYVYEQA